VWEYINKHSVVELTTAGLGNILEKCPGER
jgi:hypothetical protein